MIVDAGYMLLGFCFGCLVGAAYAYWHVRRNLKIVIQQLMARTR